MPPKQKRENIERKQRMIELRQSGLSLQAIADVYDLSKARVAEILSDVKLKRVYVPVAEAQD